ncbi:MAG: hypothetical protein RhofKO_33930 [Rhodothermales bacterium]
MANRYTQLIEHIFEEHYTEGARVVTFNRNEIPKAAAVLGIKLPKNLGDVIYSFRHRVELPQSIREKAPEGKEWLIATRGRSIYAFELRRIVRITPDPMLVATKILDATPGVVDRYAFDDEQALLAKLRYNRLIDIFTGVTCYSLQNHLRTTVRGIGQVETDELYVGIDRRGAHYMFPIQAKGGNDELGVVQIEQDMALGIEKYPDLICRPIAAQFMSDNVIALFEFTIDPTQEGDEVRKVDERHYRLVATDELSRQELERYRYRSLT